MATTTPEAALAEATASRAPKAQAPRQTAAEIRAAADAKFRAAPKQIVPLTDIRGVVTGTAEVALYGGQPVEMLMAAE